LTNTDIYAIITYHLNGGTMDKFLIDVVFDASANSYVARFTDEEVKLHSTTYPDAVCEADSLLEEVPS
tara:strand:- start:182 stop:385 length:204 start_codon:yes stop_codon:yes gene_type:complete